MLGQGIAFVVGFYLQEALELSWPWLRALQQDEAYKQWSGDLLLTYLAARWSLAVLRMRGRTRAAKRHYVIHK